MKKLLVALVASTLVVGSASVMAADPPKDKAPMVKLEKPAGVTAEAWAKMTDAEKQKAVAAAKAAAPATPAKAAAPAAPAAAAAAAAPPKKEKKGGC
jgi:uncharacterized protein YceK